MRGWQLVKRPDGMIAESDFSLVTTDKPALNDGEVYVRNTWLTVDPAMRALMGKAEEGYAPPLPLNAPLPGRAVGQVVESRSPDLKPGDKVFHTLGWRDESVGPAKSFSKLPVEADLSDDLWLGLMGMAGATAYFGLIDVTQPKAGETLFVSAAAGSIGTTVVQLGKILGLKVIASAGGPEKCDYVRKLGADEVIDYKSPGSMIDKLKKAAPKGIDIYFDNVGGDHLDAALANARPFARFSECGMIQTYNYKDARQPVPLGHLMRIIASRISIIGFTIYDYEHRLDESRRAMAQWIREGKLKPCIDVTNGIETVPRAFVGLFTGRNVGKTLIKL
jgi:NADPH-dependent curcumin reductase CurA